MPKLLVAEQKCYAIASASSRGVKVELDGLKYPICSKCSGTGLKAHQHISWNQPLCPGCWGAGYIS